MATIVKNIFLDRIFVLIGAGYGESKTERPSTALAPRYTTSESKFLAVADQAGDILWFPCHELQIVSVDGQTCRDLLTMAQKSSTS